MIEGQRKLVAVTTWRDLDSMLKVIGPDGQTPAWLPRLAELVESSSLEYLETVAENFHGFANLDPETVDLLTPTEPV